MLTSIQNTAILDAQQIWDAFMKSSWGKREQEGQPEPLHQATLTSLKFEFALQKN